MTEIGPHLASAIHGIALALGVVGCAWALAWWAQGRDDR
jgi:hypothetical protein